MKRASMTKMGLAGTAAMVVGALAFAPARTAAAPATPQRPEIFSKLIDCRAIADGTQRLACYDRQVAAMDAAAQRDEVVVLDKEGLKKTRRTLFGFTFPKLPFLGSDNDEMKPEFAAIEAKITAAREIGYGKWSLRLEDDAEWQSVEAIKNRIPRSGMTIEIKRGALGSYVGRIGDWPAFRIKRVG